MKKTILTLLIIILIILILAPFLGYLYINKILLPKRIKPQLIKIIRETTDANATIDEMFLTPAGNIIFKNFRLSALDSDKQIFLFGQLLLKTDYKRLLLVITRKHPAILLNAGLSGLRINAEDLEVSGELNLTAKISPNFADWTSSDYEGILTLSEFAIKNIPKINSLKNIGGKISFNKNKILSEDLRGFIAGIIPLTLDISVEDYLKDPNITLQLNTLDLNIACNLLKTQNNILLNKLTARLGASMLTIHGTIKNITSPEVYLTANLDANLNTLSALPLGQDYLQNINLSGQVKAEGTLSGPLSNLDQLKLSLLFSSSNITIDKFLLEDIKISALIKDKKLTIDEVSANIFNGKLSGTAGIDLTAKLLPYAVNLSIASFEISNFTPKTNANTNDLTGKLNADLKITGNISQLDKINIISNFLLDKIYYNAHPLPELLVNADVILKGDELEIKNFTAQQSETKIALKGEIKNLTQSCNARLAANINLPLNDLDNLPEDFNKSIRPLQLAGKINSDLEILGFLKNPKLLIINAKTTSAQIKIMQHELNNFALDTELKNFILNVTKCSAAFYDGDLVTRLSIDLNNKALPLEGTLSLKGINIKSYREQNSPPQSELSGDLSAELIFKGTVLPKQDLTLQCAINAPDLAYKNTSIPAVNIDTRLELKNNLLRIETLTVKSDDLIIDAQGQIPDILNPNAEISTRLTLPLELLAQFLPAPAGQSPLTLNGTINGTADISLPIGDPLMISLNAHLLSPQITINQILLSNLSTDIHMQEKLLKIAPLDFVIAKGKTNAAFSASFTADSFPYTLNVKLENLDLNQLIQQVNPATKQLSGIINATANLTGRGPDQNNIQGNVAINLADAQLYNIDLFKIIGALIGVQSLDRFDVTRGQATFKIANSVAETNDLVISGEELGFSAIGTIGFNQQVDMLASIKAPPGIASIIPKNLLDIYLTDVNGNLFTKVKITGLITNPAVGLTIDKQHLENVIEKTIKNKIEDKLKGAIFKNLPILPRAK
ncbi:MAG: AsmA family protein [Candidatus Omnitrophota bacterium]